MKEVREHLLSTLDVQIGKADAMVTSILEYSRVTTPVSKDHTLNSLIERVLKRHQSFLDQKRARLFKHFKSDLPETAVSDDRMDYILDSLVRYIWGCLPLNGSFTVVTRLRERQPTPLEPWPFRSSGGKGGASEGRTADWIEVALVYADVSRPTEQARSVSEIAPFHRKEPTDLGFLLARETLLRSRGSISFETDERARRSVLTLKLPPERRKVIHYS